jgi:hypothetical protein
MNLPETMDIKSYRRAYYLKHKDELNARSREYYRTLTPEQREHIRIAAREGYHRRHPEARHYRKLENCTSLDFPGSPENTTMAWCSGYAASDEARLYSAVTIPAGEHHMKLVSAQYNYDNASAEEQLKMWSKLDPIDTIFADKVSKVVEKLKTETRPPSAREKTVKFQSPNDAPIIVTLPQVTYSKSFSVPLELTIPPGTKFTGIYIDGKLICTYE